MEESFRILKPYLRGLPLIVMAMVISFFAAKKYLNYVTPKYESTAKIKLADVHEGVPGSNLFKDLDVFASANKIAGEIELIRSTSMISRVLDQIDFDVEIYRTGKVRRVELYHESPFKISFNNVDPGSFDKRYALQVLNNETFIIRVPGSDSSMEGNFGSPLKVDGNNLLLTLDTAFLFSKPDSKLIDNYEFEILSREKLVSRIGKDLDVVSVDKDVPVIRLNYKSPVALKASVFVNAMAEAYINDYIDTKYRAARVTVAFLDDRISDISRKLTSSEQSIQRFRDGKNIVNLRQETETDLRAISQLKIQQANLRMSLDAIEALDQYIKQGKDNFLELAPNFEAFTDLLSTEIVKKIKQLQSDKKDLLLTYTPEDERVKVIDSKIKDLTSYLQESIQNTHNNLKIKYDRLANEIQEAEKVFIGVPEKERMLTILNREFEIYERSYNFLNEKKIEAEIAQAARIAFHRVISPATPAKDPVSPNSKIIVIVATILGMFGSIVLIFIVHTVKAKVNDVYTIERNSTVPVALTTPHFNSEQSSCTHFQKEAIQLELKGLVGSKALIVISSASKLEGKSLHASSLASAFIKQGRKVCLLRVSSASENEMDTAPPTLSTLFIRNLSSQDAASFSKSKMQQYLDEFSEHDIVIVDNEPMGSESIGTLLMSLASVNLFVLDSRRTPEKEIVKAEQLKNQFSLPAFWFVLNRAGYNPNVIQEVSQFLQSMKKKLFRK